MINKKTYNELLKKVSENGFLIHQVPNKYRTEELLLASLNHANVFEMAKEQMNQYYSCVIKAVSLNGNVLEHVDIKHHNDDLYSKAIKSNPYCIQFMDKNNLSYELKYLIISIEPELIDLISINSNNFNDDDYVLCKMAIKKDWETLEFIPKIYQTEELIKMALNQSGYCLEDIINPTLEHCHYAVSRTKSAIQFIPEQTIPKHELKNLSQDEVLLKLEHMIKSDAILKDL